MIDRGNQLDIERSDRINLRGRLHASPDEGQGLRKSAGGRKSKVASRLLFTAASRPLTFIRRSIGWPLRG
jgi:hypothetical protein